MSNKSPITLRIPRVLAPWIQLSVHQGYEGRDLILPLRVFLSLVCFSMAFYIHASNLLLLYYYYHVWNSRDIAKRKVVSVLNKN